jgi:hypothetical protein
LQSRESRKEGKSGMAEERAVMMRFHTDGELINTVNRMSHRNWSKYGVK